MAARQARYRAIERRLQDLFGPGDGARFALRFGVEDPVEQGHRQVAPEFVSTPRSSTVRRAPLLDTLRMKAAGTVFLGEVEAVGKRFEQGGTVVDQGRHFAVWIDRETGGCFVSPGAGSIFCT